MTSLTVDHRVHKDSERKEQRVLGLGDKFLNKDAVFALLVISKELLSPFVLILFSPDASVQASPFVTKASKILPQGEYIDLRYFSFKY